MRVIKNIKAIIFDLGGVIVLNKAEDVYTALSEKLGVEASSLLGLYKDYKRDMLTGKLSADGFAEIVKNSFKIKEDIVGKWREAYKEVMPVNHELIKLAEELKKNYKVAMISNVPELHAQVNKERGVFSHFEPALISCDLGIDKYDKRIYELMLEKLGLKAEEGVVMDDREKLLVIPKQMGFKTILYKNNKQLIEELRKKHVKF